MAAVQAGRVLSRTPPLWIPFIGVVPDAPRYLRWVATGYSDTSHGDAWLYVFKVPVDTSEVAESYFEQQRLRVLAAPGAVRVSEVSEIQLSDGVGYTYTAVSQTTSGPLSETSYGILHEGYEYTLVIAVPPKHEDEYAHLFDDIARTFEIQRRRVRLPVAVGPQGSI
jgi:hypothetical protein